MRSSVAFVSSVLLASLTIAQPAVANNLHESDSWQFQTDGDRVNQAAIQDMIRKRKSGYYAAPVYTTNIDRQFNCNVSASAYGNSGANSTNSHSPNQAGANSNAQGNASDSYVAGGGNNPGSSSVDGNQSNSGKVGSHVHGDTDLDVRGNSWQALNSDQTNSGSQSSSIGGSNACSFGTLN
jgi:hypothetical protein